MRSSFRTAGGAATVPPPGVLTIQKWTNVSAFGLGYWPFDENARSDLAEFETATVHHAGLQNARGAAGAAGVVGGLGFISTGWMISFHRSSASWT